MKNNRTKQDYQHILTAGLKSVSQTVVDIESLLTGRGTGGGNGSNDHPSMSDLRTSELRYRRLFETAQDGILLLDAETGAITDANPFIANMLGYQPDEMIGKRLWEIGVFHDAEASKAAFEELQQNKYIRYEDLPLQTKEGQARQVEFVSNVYLVNGRDVIQCNIRDITERKSAERKLAESEKQFRQIIETAHEGIFVIDAENRITLANQRLADMVGYTIEEIIGKSLFEMLDEEGIAIAKKSLENRRQGINEQLDFKYIRKDGSTLWAIVNANSIYDQGHNYIGALAMVTDITGRKRAEEDLRFKNLILTTQQEASIDGILVVDENANIISYNNRFAQMWSVPQTWIEKKADEPVLKFIATKVADSASFEQRVQYLYGHKTETIRDEIVLKNGRIFDSYSAPMVGPDDHYYGRVWYFRDITDRKLAEKRIALLAHTLESIAECVSITDLEDTVLFVNNAFLETYGYTEQEIVGKNINVVRSPDGPPQSTSGIIQSTLKEGWTGELINRTKEGRDFPVSLSTSAVRDTQGKIVALVGVATDITDQKKFHQQLLESQKRESIGTLAGGIAHDFNNILAIILGYTFLIEKNRLDAQKLSENIATVHQAVHRGSELVRQILTFARKTDILFQPIRLTDLARELVSMLEQTFPKIITFKTTLPKDIPLILADRTQLHQALLNLCVNARDAMPDGGCITITAEKYTGDRLKVQFPTADQDMYVCISVADVGEGMTELTRRRIFDPFFTTKPQGKGTGLGLAVVYGVVQAHQGFINVESTLGHGTIFRLYFPIPKNGVKQIDSQPAKPFEAGGMETILLVEDEPDLLEMMKILLESKGYAVLVAHDGAEAVEVYKNHGETIALVLSDLGLPRMTGIEEFRKLKEINPGVIVVFASGFISPDAKSELLKGGAKGFLQKPYMSDEILRTVRETLDNQTMEGSLPQRPFTG